MKGDFKYVMTKELANSLLGHKAVGNKQKKLCEIVNRQFGCKGTCIEVIIE